LSEDKIFLRVNVRVSNNFDIFAFEYVNVSARMQGHNAMWPL